MYASLGLRPGALGVLNRLALTCQGLKFRVQGLGLESKALTCYSKALSSYVQRRGAVGERAGQEQVPTKLPGKAPE